MTEKPRETQAESHVVELKEKVNNSSLMKHRLLNGNRLRFRCSHAHEPFYPKDPLPDRIFLPYG